MTKVKTRDSYLGPLVASDERLIYGYDMGQFKPLETGFYSPETHYVVNLSLDSRMTFIERSVYNLFDFVRDVGGLVSGLNGIFIILVTII